MESFGARLKREREKRKITLDDISISTKIGTRFLVALEEDHFDQLPGGIFNKGFVRAYARHLGLDEAQTIADFEAASGPVLPEPEPMDATELAAMAVRVPDTASRREGGIPWGVFAIALLLLAFGFAVWGFHTREKSAGPSTAAPPLARADTSPGTPQEAAPASSDTAGTASQSQPQGAAPTTAPVASGAKAGVFLVLIKAREDAWVSITADENPTVQDTLTTAAERSVEAKNQVVIKTGNVGALDISFNGKKLPSQGAYNQVKTLTFDSNGLRP